MKLGELSQNDRVLNLIYWNKNICIFGIQGYRRLLNTYNFLQSINLCLLAIKTYLKETKQKNNQSIFNKPVNIIIKHSGQNRAF